MRGKNAHKRPWASPFIITYNSAPWLSSILRVYRAAGLRPNVLVDGKTNDHTEAVLRSWGVPYRRVGPAPRGESHAPDIAIDQPTGWVLRMDDDEVPSRALVDYIFGTPPPDHIAAVEVPCWHFLHGEDGRALRGRWSESTWWGQEMLHNWHSRIYRPDQVTYRDGIHTQGFIEPTNKLYAPESAAIAHLVWVVRNIEERREKIRRYDAEKEFAGSFFKNIYIPEEVPKDELEFVAHASKEFDRVVADISRMRSRLARLYRYRHRIIAQFRRQRRPAD